ncbi:AfsR/SARP family transcriptional regulator [Actinokineospora alba]|uniref:AfsR/SARP family transcriptional regulator n=1 Tax=Actinokineospora alba TaxID=504798 RepID=UPI00226BCE08|nr:BTAD domain-containing putative transcriptional regulator [Actinokineospora alba]
MFAYLTLRGGQPVSRDRLVHALWGTEAPESARGSIYTYVAGLRKDMDLAGASVRLMSARTGYTMNLADFDTDARRFDRHWSAGRTLAETAAIAEFDAALKLWNGAPLAGAGGALVDTERAGLVEQWLAMAEQRGTLMLELGGQEYGLASELSLLTDLHPLRERLRALFRIRMCDPFTNGRLSWCVEREVYVDQLGIQGIQRVSWILLPQMAPAGGG